MISKSIFKEKKSIELYKTAYSFNRMKFQKKNNLKTNAFIWNYKYILIETKNFIFNLYNFESREKKYFLRYYKKTMNKLRGRWRNFLNFF